MLGLPSTSKSMHKLAMIQGQRKHRHVGIFFTKFPRKPLCLFYKLIDLVNSTSNKRSGGIIINVGENPTLDVIFGVHPHSHDIIEI